MFLDLWKYALLKTKQFKYLCVNMTKDTVTKNICGQKMFCAMAVFPPSKEHGVEGIWAERWGGVLRSQFHSTPGQFHCFMGNIISSQQGRHTPTKCARMHSQSNLSGRTPPPHH